MSRADIARVVAGLRDVPQFWDYVKTLEAKRDAAIHTLLYEPQPANVEVLRGEARAYDTLIKDIANNGGKR